MTRYLVLGNGWLGNKLHNYLKDSGENSILSKERIEITDTIRQIRNLIKEYKPEVVINAIGKTGRPTVDWCESNKESTFISNVMIPTMMAEVCEEMDKYMVHLGSGCIFEGGNPYSGYNEAETPNFKGSFYSRTKIYSEQILKWYGDILQIRIRMPIDDIPSKRNLITKLIGYRKVIGDVQNSITYIPDLLEVSKKLMDRRETGIYNVVNRGPITHREILQMYKEIVDPDYDMPEFIGLEELSKMTIAGRSNCILDVIKLDQNGIKIRDVRDAVRTCMTEYTKYLKKGNMARTS